MQKSQPRHQYSDWQEWHSHFKKALNERASRRQQGESNIPPLGVLMEAIRKDAAKGRKLSS